MIAIPFFSLYSSTIGGDGSLKKFIKLNDMVDRANFQITALLTSPIVFCDLLSSHSSWTYFVWIVLYERVQ